MLSIASPKGAGALTILITVGLLAAVGCGRQESAARRRANEGAVETMQVAREWRRTAVRKADGIRESRKTPQRWDKLECLKHSSFVSSRRNAMA